MFPLTALCVATYLKGEKFLRECRRRGCRVVVVTAEPVRDAPWPPDAIDRLETVPRDASDVRKAHHAGLIVASPDPARVEQLLGDDTERFYRDLHATAPPADRPID